MKNLCDRNLYAIVNGEAVVGETSSTSQECI